MERSQIVDKERIAHLVQGLINSEIELLPKDSSLFINELKLTKAKHLLVKKITSSRNTEFILINSTADVKIIIGTGKKTTRSETITINLNSPLCFNQI